MICRDSQAPSSQLLDWRWSTSNRTTARVSDFCSWYNTLRPREIFRQENFVARPVEEIRLGTGQISVRRRKERRVTENDCRERCSPRQDSSPPTLRGHRWVSLGVQQKKLSQHSVIFRNWKLSQVTLSKCSIWKAGSRKLSGVKLSITTSMRCRRLTSNRGHNRLRHINLPKRLKMINRAPRQAPWRSPKTKPSRLDSIESKPASRTTLNERNSR